jgi:alpha-methylacyl-CoA racemase
MERMSSGEGQVVDVAMIDGSALLTTNFHGMVASGTWDERRGHNQCPAAPFYDVYETADGKYVAIGAQEPKFYRSLMVALGFDVDTLPEQHDRISWSTVKEQVAARVRQNTRDEWDALLCDGDACLSPVLSFREAPSDAHNVARQTFVSCGEVLQPAPAPRFGRTPAPTPSPPPAPGQDTEVVLASIGYTAEERSALKSGGIVS